MEGMDMSTASVHDIISPLYTNRDAYASSSVVAYLKSISLARSTLDPKTTYENDKLRARQVAQVDPGFKDFLISIGWKTSEFTANVIPKTGV